MTASAWLVAARKADVENTSPSSLRDHRPGSKVTKPQYLTIRTLVVPRKVQDFEPATWGLSLKLITATQEVNQFPGFHNTLNTIDRC